MLLMIHKPRPTTADRVLAGLSRAAAATLTGIDAVLMWPFRASENRRLVETLGAMSDHDLRDIGLTRHDLRDTLALPLDRDAGAFLADRRSSRRLRP
jgi:uncharacterized protein YjiS (DUF1127 family)